MDLKSGWLPPGEGSAGTPVLPTWGVVAPSAQREGWLPSPRLLWTTSQPPCGLGRDCMAGGMGWSPPGGPGGRAPVPGPESPCASLGRSESVCRAPGVWGVTRAAPAPCAEQGGLLGLSLVCVTQGHV